MNHIICNNYILMYMYILRNLIFMKPNAPKEKKGWRIMWVHLTNLLEFSKISSLYYIIYNFEVFDIEPANFQPKLNPYFII